MKHLLVILIFFLIVPALAKPTKGGNGGYIISCPGEKPQLLDYYEGEHFLNMPTAELRDIFPKQRTYEELYESGNLAQKKFVWRKVFEKAFVNLRYQSNRLFIFSKYVLRDAHNYFKDGKFETVFKERAKQNRIAEDIGLTWGPLPKKCELKPVIIQRARGKKTNYRVNCPLFMSLDLTHQMGLLHHEMVYQYFIKHYGHRHSTMARYHTAYVGRSNGTHCERDDRACRKDRAVKYALVRYALSHQSVYTGDQEQFQKDLKYIPELLQLQEWDGLQSF